MKYIQTSMNAQKQKMESSITRIRRVHQNRRGIYNEGPKISKICSKALMQIHSFRMFSQGFNSSSYHKALKSRLMISFSNQTIWMGYSGKGHLWGATELRKTTGSGFLLQTRVYSYHGEKICFNNETIHDGCLLYCSWGASWLVYDVFGPIALRIAMLTMIVIALIFCLHSPFHRISQVVSFKTGIYNHFHSIAGLLHVHFHPQISAINLHSAFSALPFAVALSPCKALVSETEKTERSQSRILLPQITCELLE